MTEINDIRSIFYLALRKKLGRDKKTLLCDLRRNLFINRIFLKAERVYRNLINLETRLENIRSLKFLTNSTKRKRQIDKAD